MLFSDLIKGVVDNTLLKPIFDEFNTHTHSLLVIF